MHADLLIRVMRYRGRAPDTPVSAVFSTQGGTLGCDPHCTLRLPDPDGHIAPVQARILFIESRFQLVGASHTLHYNGDPVGAGLPIELYSGDELQFGDYVLGVEMPMSVAAAISPVATP